MYKNTSATPAGQDLTVHLGLDITGSDETKLPMVHRYWMQ